MSDGAGDAPAPVSSGYVNTGALDVYYERHVWRVLTDFPAYREWNPFITSIRGPLEVGAQLEITIRPRGYPEFTFTPIVKSVDRRREL